MAGRLTGGYAMLLRVADAVMSPDEFFRLVDEFLTPPMALLGYHRIGGYENDEPRSRTVLTALDAPSLGGKSTEGTPFRLYDFGFEAGSDTAARLVDPVDPVSAEELWLSYEPATGELELAAWSRIAEGRVDWDPWSDSGHCHGPEVRRRLTDLGRAVVDLAQEGGSPPTS
jgi:hypothetical protein